ncbi:MAG: glutathione S-transferase [Myxococcota bacterium]|jgi:glutathione S-transferase
MLRLLTIPISHYCDKARWALERAGLEYREEAHLQGWHWLATRRVGGGRTVPVLVTPDAVLTDSTDIVAWADTQLPAHQRLLTEEAAPWDARFGATLGPAARMWTYDRVATDYALAAEFGTPGTPGWQRGTLPLTYPMMLRVIRRILDWSDATLPGAIATVDREFDAVAEVLRDGRPYLCGDQFTAADLTFASMAAAVVFPPEYGVPLPTAARLSAEAAREHQRWRDHPAGAFALQLYTRHRRDRLSREQ